MQNIANIKTQKIAQDKQTKSGGLPLPMRISFLENLQRSLDLRDTLEHLQNAINLLVRVDSLHYLFESKEISVDIGRRKRSCICYNLLHPQGKLGALTFTRSKPFAETELATIETFIGLIVGPLNNALLYRDAVTNSLRDALTKLGNRAALDNSLQREVALAHRNQLPMSIIIADLDCFKTVNDQFGHPVGDKAILHAVKCFQRSLRKTDQIFRFGGEEFVIVLPNSKNNSALSVAERIRKTLNLTMFEHQDQQIPILASMGIASLHSQDTLDTLFDRADAALYAAKQSGRNCCKSGESGAIRKARSN